MFSMGFPEVFAGLFILALIFIACVAIFVFYAITRGWKASKKAGFDPMTMNVQVAAKAMDSKLLAPNESIEDRLLKIDDLRSRGVITEAEHAAGRAEIIRGA